QIRFNYANLSAGVAAQNEGLAASVGIKNANSSSGNLVLAFNNGPTAYVGSGKSTLMTPPSSAPDYYSFAAAAGQTISLAATALGANPVTVQLYDATGANLLANGTAGAGNITSAIETYQVPVAGTYYAAITSSAIATYSLSVVTNSAFDAEANDSAGAAQPLGTAGGVYGYVTSTGPNEDWYSVALPADGVALK